MLTVKEHPVLYAKDAVDKDMNVSYKDKDKGRVWEAVLQKLKDSDTDEEDMTVKEAQALWKSLRDRYGKEVKKVGKSGDGASFKSTWPLLGPMSFLEPHRRPPKTDGFGDDSEDDCVAKSVVGESGTAGQESVQVETNTGGEEQEATKSGEGERTKTTEQPKKKSKPNNKRSSNSTTAIDANDDLSSVIKSLNREDDEDELWAMSVAKTMKRLTHHRKAVLKANVQSLLVEAEFGPDRSHFPSHSTQMNHAHCSTTSTPAPFSNSSTPHHQYNSPYSDSSVSASAMSDITDLMTFQSRNVM